MLGVASLASASSLPGLLPDDVLPSEVSGILITEQASGRILLMNETMDWADPAAVRWIWDPATADGLTAQQRQWFGNPTEAKPVRGGEQLLITASGGGLALVDFPSGRVAFAAHVGGNPHSAALLPGGGIVVASSNGDRVTLYLPEASNNPIQTTTLVDAHGLEWDEERHCLWALGGKTMAQYGYDPEADNPELILQQSFDLPVTPESQQYPRHGGHDLVPIPGEDAYFVTDMDHLWRFDPETLAFDPLEQRHLMPGSNSISQLGPGGEIIVLQETESWWATGPRTLDDEQVWHLPDARIYKARWWPAAVPEPTSAAVLGLGALALTRRR
ncbi:MAG: DUF6528 family protein [Phycisphaerales bacterium JB063]